MHGIGRVNPLLISHKIKFKFGHFFGSIMKQEEDLNLKIRSIFNHGFTVPLALHNS